MTPGALTAHGSQPLIEASRSQTWPVHIGRNRRRHIELELRLCLQGLDQRGQLVALRLLERGAAGMKIDVIHLLTAAKEAAEGGERCGGDLGQQPEYRLPDEW